MKVTVWREKILALVTEVRDLLKSVVEGNGGNSGGGGGGGGEARYLQPTIEALGAAFNAWDDPDKEKYFLKLTLLCMRFRDWLAKTYENVQRVNDQQERHRYRETNPERHADAIVLIRDPANPSRDIVIDYCYGSSEGGCLLDKLQCLWHDGPYSWWTDNAFPQDKEAGK